MTSCSTLPVSQVTVTSEECRLPVLFALLISATALRWHSRTTSRTGSGITEECRSHSVSEVRYNKSGETTAGEKRQSGRINHTFRYVFCTYLSNPELQFTQHDCNIYLGWLNFSCTQVLTITEIIEQHLNVELCICCYLNILTEEKSRNCYI